MIKIKTILLYVAAITTAVAFIAGLYWLRQEEIRPEIIIELCISASAFSIAAWQILKEKEINQNKQKESHSP